MGTGSREKETGEGSVSEREAGEFMCRRGRHAMLCHIPAPTPPYVPTRQAALPCQPRRDPSRRLRLRPSPHTTATPASSRQRHTSGRLPHHAPSSSES